MRSLNHENMTLVRCQYCDGAGEFHGEEDDDGGSYVEECEFCEGCGYFTDHQGGTPAFELMPASDDEVEALTPTTRL